MGVKGLLSFRVMDTYEMPTQFQLDFQRGHILFVDEFKGVLPFYLMDYGC